MGPLDSDDIRVLYTRLAPVYDLWAAFAEGAARKRALDRARIRDGERVLEVAVGTGLGFEAIVRENPTGTNVGVDLTQAMLDRARRRIERAGLASRCRLACADARALPFEEDGFDVVSCSYLFDLLPEADFAPALAEFRRVLSSEGRMVLVNMTPGTGPIGRVADVLFRIRPELFGGCRAVGLEPFVRDAGFGDVQREVITQLGVSSEIIVARPAR